MRKILFESLVGRPLTEPGPQLDDPEIIALAQEIESAARVKLDAVSPSAKSMRARAMVVSLKSMPSAMPFTISSDSVSGLLPRLAMPMFCSSRGR